MRIRMVTTAAGPNGVWPAGSVQRVDQETGKTLVRYGFAQAIDPEAWAPLTDEDKREIAQRVAAGRQTATAAPVVERAIDPVTSEIPKSAAPKPAAKKSPAKKSAK